MYPENSCWRIKAGRDRQADHLGERIMELNVSTWNYLCERGDNANIDEAIGEIVADGFGVEIWLGWSPEPNIVERPAWKRLKELLDQAPAVSLHTRLDHYDPRAARQEIDMCAYLGGKVVVVHQSSLGLDENTNDFGHVCQLAQYAEDRGVHIALENGNFQILRRVVSQVDLFSPQGGLGVCIDVGHANLCQAEFESPIERFLDEFHWRLVHLHLADNFGKNDDHLAPGEGAIDWRKVVSKLEQLHFRAGATLEIRSSEARQKASEARRFLQTLESER